MKTMVWKQFSSNHSASFEIVGTFADGEQARKAAEAIRDILRSVTDYHEHSVGNDAGITPIEKTLMERYGLIWEHPIDWGIPPDATAEEVVVQQGRYLHIRNRGRTWSGTTPFEELMIKHGAQVAGWREVGRQDYPFVCLTCDAPDEATAQQIIDQVVEHWYSTDSPVIGAEIPNVTYTSAEYRPQRHGKRLIFQTDTIGFWQEMHRIIAYVEKWGCTNIRYAFGECPDEAEL